MKNSRNHSSTNRRRNNPAEAQASQRLTAAAFPHFHRAKEQHAIQVVGTPPDSEINGLLKSQDGDISSLQAAIDRLRERLVPVLIPVPDVESGVKAQSSVSSQFGTILEQHNIRIESFIGQINNIINQLAI